MQSVWRWFADQFVCNLVVFLWPLVLHGQLSQTLASSQSCLNSLISPKKVVLWFLKDLLCFQDLQKSLIPLQHLLCEHKLRKLVDIKAWFASLLPEDFGALRARRLQGLDPWWIGRHGGMCLRRREVGYCWKCKQRRCSNFNVFRGMSPSSPALQKCRGRWPKDDSNPILASSGIRVIRQRAG